MDIEYLRELVELDKVRSFTKAASRLGISRTTLSKHISAVEAEFGVRAFERDNLHVKPTSAGRVLLREAQMLLESWDAMHAQVASLRRREPLSLRVGLFVGHRPTDDLVRTVEENLLRKGMPVDVEVVEVTSPCFQGLREKDYDFISPVHGDEVDLTDLADELFLREPICAVVPVGSPLFKKETLDLHDLDEQTVFVSHEGSIRHYFTWMEQELARRGVHPNYMAVPYANWFEFNHMLPGLAGGIGLVHASMPSISMPLALRQYRAIRFDDEDFCLPIHITWRADDNNAALKLFVDEFRAVMSVTDFSAYWNV